jgi:ketosteroid isomerase-like protein
MRASAEMVAAEARNASRPRNASIVLGILPEFEVKIEDVNFRIDMGDHVFAEYPAHPVAAPTGRLTHQLFMVYLVAKNGKIVLLREGLNTVAAASALLPG